MAEMADATKQAGYQDILLDFSELTHAYPNGMIPIICTVDKLAHEGIEFDMILPEVDQLRRLFFNTNWAHYLSPGEFDMSDTVHDRHLAAHRFRTFEDQRAIVDGILDVAMRNLMFEREILAGLEWSFNEITDNVLNHAESDLGGFAQVSTFRDSGTVAFAVGDSGRGILASLRQAMPFLQKDSDALGEAVKAGVTRSPDAGQGNGLAGTMRIAEASGGSFEITSGYSQLVVRQGESKVWSRRENQYYVGTLVAAQLPIDASIGLAELLGFGGRLSEPADLIELKYHTDDHEALMISLLEETTGCGTRISGKQMRIKCNNLLNAEPGKPLLIDWRGIPLVSSSFADEFLGKLFVELGPLAFSSRIRNINLEPVVRSLLDAAVSQRMVQAATRT